MGAGAAASCIRCCCHLAAFCAKFACAVVPYSSCARFSFHVLMWEVFTGEKPKRGSLRPVKVPEECPQVGRT